jgi:type VI secretion system protein ImpM
MTPGWFGKLAMLGDFAHRRLDAAFVTTCDDWLSQCVRRSREQLGGEWLDRYLGAPLWRFAWAPGVVDAQWWFGVLMPSVDAAGRYFPLVVAAPSATAPACAAGLRSLDDWHAAVGAAALATLADGMRVDDFEAALAAVPAWVDPRAAAANAPAPANVPANASTPETANATATAGTAAPWACSDCADPPCAGGPAPGGPGLPLHTAVTGRSHWWVSPNGITDAGHISSCTGLPPPALYAQMLEGPW